MWKYSRKSIKYSSFLHWRSFHSCFDFHYLTLFGFKNLYQLSIADAGLKGEPHMIIVMELYIDWWFSGRNEGLTILKVRELLHWVVGIVVEWSKKAQLNGKKNTPCKVVAQGRDACITWIPVNSKHFNELSRFYRFLYVDIWGFRCFLPFKAFHLIILHIWLPWNRIEWNLR